ncbi:hypothetical protein [Cupriavidus plantarum]|uniref:Uncharacterized protein n=1 Tax=Cupriavidus plantarum TaxID=942865 RepID=A0A316EWY5_9BURK|nr:hypothetical protein [Cupriavidus plantarum]PWK35453.1 hypothetical protein C7419_102731 [Cupriavidus plantarum]
MSTIIAGRFETFARAENAANRMLAQGFRQDDLSMFYVNPPGQHGAFPIGGDRAVDPAARGTGKGAGRGIMVGAAVGVGVGVCACAAMRAWMDAPLQSWLLVLTLALTTGIGAYIGSLIGALSLTSGVRRDPRTGQPQVRNAGVLLAAHVSPDNTALAAQLLRTGGAEEVERAEGQWRNGQWEDFDPLQPPKPAEVMPVETR